MSLLKYTPVFANWLAVEGAVFERETMVVSEKIFPSPEGTIVLVVSSLGFRFVSPLITRRISLPSSPSINVY